MKSFWRIFKYTLPYRLNIGLNILFNLFSAIFSLFSIVMLIPLLEILFGEREPVLVKPEFSISIYGFLDQVNYHVSRQVSGGSEVKGLITICSIVIVIFFLKNLTRYLAAFVMIPLRNGVVRDLRNKLYGHSLQLPIAFFSESKKGDIISRMTSDVQEIEWGILNTMEALIKEPLTIIIFLIALISFNPMLTLFVFILLPVSGFIIGYIGRTLKKQSKQGQEKLGGLISIIEESLGGIRIIKAFMGHKFQQRKFETGNENWRKIMTRVMRRRDLASPTTEFLGMGIVVVLIWFGGRMVFKGDIEASILLTFIVLFSQILNPAKSFSQAYFYIQKGLASVERVETILDAPVTIHDTPDSKSITSFEDSIIYDHVGFAYEEKAVLKNIQIEIKKGKVVALVGQSGAGKSTIVDLLPRFHDLKEGKIVIDGIDIKDYKINDLRSLMGIVSQEPILFNDTVFNNIAFGVDTVSEEAVMQAAKVANAHDYIVKMPKGYQTIIGDRGLKLSGGERQRLTIARAVFKNPPILILDEATSSLDTESEKLVQDALYKLMKHRTTIVIAHRLSTVQGADEILVLNEGEIVERGTHQSLLEKNGAYKKLVDLQAFGS